MEIAKAYDPKEAEQSHYQRWETSGFFRPEINENPDAEKFSIVIPPPNVTGNLHMGHALQHTIMDVLTRWKRMQGYRTLFLVGVDHAGISTQLMVTRQLKKEEHKTPQDIGRAAFTEKVWAWKKKYGGEITRQMRVEGLSVDWSREKFTMDDDLSSAVREVFVRLYEEGWIYRGTRIVNWCPKDKTVLSDLEIKESKAKEGKLYYLKYPLSERPASAGGSRSEPPASAGGEDIESSQDKLKSGAMPPAYAGGSDFVVVATTRPETMLGDTAVAVNPEDERYKVLIGKKIALPLTDREIPIVADEYVESEFGTGAVKITPAHDPNDWEIGERHGLEKLVVMNDDATMNAAAGVDFEGLDRYDARTKVVERFTELGLLEKVEDYDVTLPHCERCGTVIEPLLSLQWFVKMDEMRDLALGLMERENSPRFIPEVPNRKVYTTWLENLRDWTISRQLWWGHQIPAWYDEEGNVYVARSEQLAQVMAPGRKLTQDPDVLDTWFSSALWPFSTLGWSADTPVRMSAASARTSESGSEPSIGQDRFAASGDADKSVCAPTDLETFYPTDVLVTGRDIIFLWVSRMVMSGMKFIGEKPFDDVLIHGTVLDKNGQRMSKTKQNGIDPLDVFAKFGVDATRMTLAGSATGADFAWRDEKVESFRNFANKIWNATRFCLLNSEGAAVDPSILAEDIHSLEVQRNQAIGTPVLADWWIEARFSKTAKAVNTALATYQFHEAVQLLYHFFWDDFCDWYIELSKDVITGQSDVAATDDLLEDAGRAKARSRILTILEQSLRLLHPFMPFLTEELWQQLPGTDSHLHNPAYSRVKKSIMLTDYPNGEFQTWEAAERVMGYVIDVISKVRNIRSEMNIRPSDRVSIHIATADDEMRRAFLENEVQIKKLARADTIVLSENLDVPKASAKAVLSGGAEIAVPLEGLIDFDKERERLQNQIAKLDIELQRLNAQLSNANFVERAPAEKVEELKVRKDEIESQTQTLRSNKEALI